MTSMFAAAIRGRAESRDALDRPRKPFQLGSSKEQTPLKQCGVTISEGYLTQTGEERRGALGQSASWQLPVGCGRRSSKERSLTAIIMPSESGCHRRVIAASAGVVASVVTYNCGASALVGSHELIGLAVFVAATTSAVAGFAFSAICGAMLFRTSIAPVDAVTIMVVCSIANQALSVWALRRQLSFSRMAPYLPTGLIGVPIGINIMVGADPTDYRRAVGLLLVVVCAWSLARPGIVVRRPNRAICGLFGLASGVTGGLAALPSAPTVLRVGMFGWSKEEQRAVYQPLILALQIEALLLLALRSHTLGGDALIGTSMVAYVPGSILGTWLGIRFFRRLTDRQFGHAVNTLLIVSGVLLMA